MQLKCWPTDNGNPKWCKSIDMNKSPTSSLISVFVIENKGKQKLVDRAGPSKNSKCDKIGRRGNKHFSVGNVFWCTPMLGNFFCDYIKWTRKKCCSNSYICQYSLPCIDLLKYVIKNPWMETRADYCRFDAYMSLTISDV